MHRYFFGLQLPFEPGVFPGVGSYPFQQRLDLPLLDDFFDELDRDLVLVAAMTK